MRKPSLDEGILIEEAFPADDQLIFMNRSYNVSDELVYDQNSLESFDLNQHVNINSGDNSSVLLSMQDNEESHKTLNGLVLSVTESIENTKI